MRLSPPTALTLTLLFSLVACSGGSKGDNGGTATITPDFPCLVGKTWSLRAVSSSNVQQVGTWRFDSNERYVWTRSKPLPDSGTGKYKYDSGVLTVDGYLQNRLVKSGLIKLTFDRNRMSFTDDNGTTWIYDPPASCALVMVPHVSVKTGEWRFDMLPDSGDAPEKLTAGELLVEQNVIRVDGDPRLQGAVGYDRIWEVQVDAGFSFRGEFRGAPADRFQGTYVHGNESGQILGYRL